MAEAEQRHRHRWERSALNNTTIGLWFGFLIDLGLVGGGDIRSMLVNRMWREDF
jgi:hypothetical protein